MTSTAKVVLGVGCGLLAVTLAGLAIYAGYTAQMRAWILGFLTRDWILVFLTGVVAVATWKTWRVYLRLAETAEKTNRISEETNRISEMMTMETRLNRESEIAPLIVPVWDSAVTFHLTNEGRGRACDVRVTEPAEASRMTSIMLEPGQSDGGRGVAVSDAPNRRRLTITYSDILGNRFETISTGRSS